MILKTIVAPHRLWMERIVISFFKVILYFNVAYQGSTSQDFMNK